MNDLLKISITAAIEAGKEILDVYKNEFEVETKTDNSPLTEADKRSHNKIKEILSPLSIEMLSEEGKQLSYEDRKHWKKFWLIDPLDGTKEFIKRNGEFTVNIALVEEGVPVVRCSICACNRKDFITVLKIKAVIVLRLMKKKIKQWNHICNQQKNCRMHAPPEIFTIVASRSHNTPETEEFINEKREKYGTVNCVSSGSSIKLCLVAEGKANIYPRLAPTMEWDTAAGHAVAKFAGCNVYDYKTGNELQYNKENLLNPWFVVERS